MGLIILFTKLLFFAQAFRLLQTSILNLNNLVIYIIFNIL